MSATAELIARIALKWMDKRPFSAEAKARRKAKRQAKREARKGVTEDTKGMALDLGTRTSTNTVVGTPPIAIILIQLMQMVPNMAFVEFISTPTFAAVFTSVIAWAIARISKTYVPTTT